MQLELGQPIGFMMIKIGHAGGGEAKKNVRCNKCELVRPCGDFFLLIFFFLFFFLV